MSEVKLNLIDSRQVLHGTIHGSVADACVAALSAEPETIAELSAALARYIKPLDDHGPFATFYSSGHSSVSSSAKTPLDTRHWDAGIVVIDLMARIVASESTYSQPQAEGEVHYHDGTKSTDVPVLYRLPNDWLFVNSIEAYQWSRERRVKERLARTPLDVREVLYGAPLLEFIINAIAALAESGIVIPAKALDAANGDGSDFPHSADGEGLGERSASGDQTLPLSNGGEETNTDDTRSVDDDAEEDELAREISRIHALWLMTPREDLGGSSPRDVMLARQDFIDFDLHTRSMQWSLLDEGPPCLSTDSFAYRFAGFGTHEWIIYYDLVRHLLWTALNVRQTSVCREPGVIDQAKFVENSTDTGIDSEITQLNQLKTAWLEQPQPDYDGRTPAILIDNERKRLPIALRPRDMIVDDDCPVCQMFGDETSPLGMGVGFWHLDGCNMDEDFAFSDYPTREEWEAENHRREEFSKEFDRRWEERQQRIARGETLEHDPFFDPDPFPGLEFDDPTLVPDKSIDDEEKELPQ